MTPLLLVDETDDDDDDEMKEMPQANQAVAMQRPRSAPPPTIRNPRIKLQPHHVFVNIARLWDELASHAWRCSACSRVIKKKTHAQQWTDIALQCCEGLPVRFCGL